MKDIHASFNTIGASDERSLKGGKREQQSLSRLFMTLQLLMTEVMP